MEAAVAGADWRERMRTMTTEYIELDDAVKRVTVDIKPLKKRKTALENDILESMVSAGVDACNISGTSDKLLVRTHRKKAASKKGDYLERLVAFFDGDEARAQQCLDALNDTQVVEVRRLKRVTKKQEAPGGAATSGSSDEG
eukprot:jgi/Mesvir1/11123/Mv06262-RA.1